MTWYPEPRQARSQRSTQALLDAATSLLDEKPFDQVTVQQLVGRAGVSTGTFYARFGGKEAILHALHEQVLAEMEEAFGAMGTPANLEEAIAGHVSTLVRQLRRQRLRLTQIRRNVSPAARPVFEERSRAFQDRISARVRTAFEAGGHRLTHPQPGLAVTLALFFAAAAAREAVLEDGLKTWPVAIGDDILAREITRSCLGYLGLAHEM